MVLLSAHDTCFGWEMIIIILNYPCLSGSLSLAYTSRGQKFHSSARNYEWNLEGTSNFSQSTVILQDECFGKNYSRKSYNIFLPLFFIADTFKGQVHVFAEWVSIVSHSSCRTSAILKYFCPLTSVNNCSKISNAFLFLFWNKNVNYQSCLSEKQAV